MTLGSLACRMMILIETHFLPIILICTAGSWIDPSSSVHIPLSRRWLAMCLMRRHRRGKCGLISTIWGNQVFIVAKHFTARLAGRKVKQVCCEKCQTQFCYELTREVKGVGSAPYFLMQGRAQRQAVERATVALEKALEVGQEVVPCPKCHWVNQRLAQTYLKQIMPSTIGRILLALAIGFSVMMLLPLPIAYLPGDQIGLAAILMLLTFLATAASPIWFVLRRRKLRRRLDPNANFPMPTPLKTPIPEIFLHEKDQATGEMVLVPAPGDELAIPASYCGYTAPTGAGNCSEEGRGHCQMGCVDPRYPSWRVINVHCCEDIQRRIQFQHR